MIYNSVVPISACILNVCPRDGLHTMVMPIKDKVENMVKKEKGVEQVFRVKKLVGRRAPLNSNYLLLLLYCSHPYYMNP